MVLAEGAVSYERGTPVDNLRGEDILQAVEHQCLLSGPGSQGYLAYKKPPPPGTLQ